MFHSSCVSISSKIISSSLLAFLSAVVVAQADLPQLSGDETVLFKEDFAQNSNHWNPVAVVNEEGDAQAGMAAIAGSAWTASVPSDGDDFSSQIQFSESVDLSNGPISVYMRARTSNPMGTDGSRFSFMFKEAMSNRFFGFLVRPFESGMLQYRDIDGGGSNTKVGRILFDDTYTDIDFKVTLTPPASEATMASVEAFIYDVEIAAYVSLGSALDLVDLDAGTFNELSLYSRNGVEEGAVYIDSIVITQSIH
jgi:hypothetical protein